MSDLRARVCLVRRGDLPPPVDIPSSLSRCSVRASPRVFGGNGWATERTSRSCSSQDERRSPCRRGTPAAGATPRTRGRARAGDRAAHRAQVARPRGSADVLRESGAILPQRELARMVNEVSDEVVGFGPIEFLLKDPGGHRGDGQRTRRRVRGAGGADRKGAGRLIRGGGSRLAPDRTDRGSAGPPGRRIVTLGGRATSGGQQGARDRSASFAPRSRAHDPQVLPGPHHGGRPRRATGASDHACCGSWSRACGGART